MAAAIADRNTIRAGRMGVDGPTPFGIKAATKIFAGTLCVNDAGVAAPGRTATGLAAIGVARRQYDNTAGAANALVGEFDIGDYWFVNASGDPLLLSDVGALAYITDDTTVNKTAAGKSIAGRLINVDPALGALVRVGPGYV